MSTATFDEQDKLLDDASSNVKKQAYYMKKALEDADIAASLRYAAKMIFELRTSRLSPQSYYELYIAVTDELRYLELFLEEEQKRALEAGDKLDLYEVVQYCGNIVPRMYLLMTVGSICIKNGVSQPMEVLQDLVELAKGVQHPTRGLFLRCYLSQISKDKLPDSSDDIGSQEDEVKKSIDFIIQNFGEVNRLWVRMQHQGPVRDRGRREKERQNLRMLVGTNLVRLSQLEAVTLEIYEKDVLPRVLQLIIECKDKIAQEYLMDCLIQVFPDEYHLKTLSSFLASLAELKVDVDIKNIVIALMNRLSEFALKSPDQIPADLDMFVMFQSNVSKIMQEKDSWELDNILSLQVALLNFASKVYPEKLSYLDQVLEVTVGIFESRQVSYLTAVESRLVVQLLTVPLETIGLRVFDLKLFSPLMDFLSFELRRQVAFSVASSVTSSRTIIKSLDVLTTMLQFIAPLIKDASDTPDLTSGNQYEFQKEQDIVAKLIHLVHNEDTDEHYRLLMFLRNQLGEGGEHRFKTTLPPLIFKALSLADRIHKREVEEKEIKVKTKKVYQFIHKVTSVLIASLPITALRLFTTSALSSDRHGFEEITYEFLTQAFTIYEEEIADSSDLDESIALIVGTVEQLRSLDDENYDTMSTQATQHSARLLKKGMKANAVLRCAHLFWTGDDMAPGTRKGKSVLMCLKRALKITFSIMDVSEKVSLYIQALKKYTYFFEKGVEQISQEDITNLVELIRTSMDELDEGQERDEATIAFNRCLQRIQDLKSE